MTYLDEFRNPKLAKGLVKRITKLSSRNMKLLTGGGGVSGVAYRSGLVNMLPKEVKIIQGPGCPRSTTPIKLMDHAIAISDLPDTVVAIHGGFATIPSSSKSLDAKRAEGSDIRTANSCQEALNIAIGNPEKKIVFVALGYEITASTVASTVIEAQRKEVENFYVLSGHLIFTSTFRALLEGKENPFDGLLLPGPVSTVIGSRAYDFIAEKYKLPCVIAGKEICDIALSIYMLLKQIEEGKPRVEIQYTSCVKEEGNLKARQILNEVFEVCDSSLRGFGAVPKSGLKLRQKYEQFDAERACKVKVETKEPKGCICGEVLRGVSTPSDCPLFGTTCNPSWTIGPCMDNPQGVCTLAYHSHSSTGLLGRFSKLRG